MLASGLWKAAPPRARHSVAVGSGHILRVREYGSPSGLPLVYLHGGPGGTTPPRVAQLVDPAMWRLFTFDQRGCGECASEDALRDNMTGELVADVEAVRRAVGVDRWVVMGSSYGTLLAALYAARHAEHVSGVVIHATFLGSRRELEWLYEGGAASFYPEYYAELEEAVAEELSRARARGETLPHVAACHAMIDDDRPERADARKCAAAAFVAFEDAMETLRPEPAEHADEELIRGATIQAHYFMHGCFLRPPEGALPELREARQALSAVPCAIVHGRHDVICPPRAAHDLHSAWPRSELHVVEGGAHALFEKPMRSQVQLCLLKLAQALGGASSEPAGGGNKRSRHARS